ncbi:MAG: alpha/beta hydrolase [Phycisphaerae bacterium]
MQSALIRPAIGAAVVVVMCIGARGRAEPLASSAVVSPQRVSVEAEDGVLIVGDYYPPLRHGSEGAPMVILLHMAGSGRSAWRPLVPHLHAIGCAVLAIDLRGYGESIEPKGFNLAKRAADRDSRLHRAMYKDVTAAYLWLVRQKEVDPARFAIVGAGLGAAVALDYAARDRSVDAVACLSPGMNYAGLEPSVSIRKCESRAILLLAAKGDGEVAELQRAAVKATVRFVADAGGGDSTLPRGTDLLGKSKDLGQTIAAFVERSVGRAGAEPVVASTNSDVYHVPDTSHAQRIKDENRRWFSSAAEAEARGLRPVKKRASRSGEARQASPKARDAVRPDPARSAGPRGGNGR